MPYRCDISRQAGKAIKELPPEAREHLVARLLQACEDPWDERITRQWHPRQARTQRLMTFGGYGLARLRIDEGDPANPRIILRSVTWGG